MDAKLVYGDEGDPGDQPPTPDVPRPSFTDTATQPVQPLTPRWNAGDDLRYSRKVTGLSQVLDDLDSGELHPEFARPLVDRYQSDLNGMDQQRLAAQAFQQQSATQVAMHGIAMQQAVGVQNAQHLAQAFPATLAQHVDSDGNVHDFFQHRLGEWKQVDKPTADQGEYVNDQPAESERAVGDQPAEPLAPDGKPYGDQPRTRTVVGEDGVPRLQTIPSKAQFEAAVNSSPDGALTIRNGGFTDQYQDGRLVGSNRPRPAAEPQGDPHDYYRQAEKVVGPAPPRMLMGPRGPVPNPQFTKWMGSRQAMATDLAKEDRQRMREDEHRRQEQVRADAAAKKDDWNKAYDHSYGTLSKELDRVRKANAEAPGAEPVPDWGKDEDTMHAEAVRRADRRVAANPKNRDSSTSTPATPAEATPSATPAAAAAPPPAQVQVPPALKAKYDEINAAHGAEHAQAAQRDDKPGLLRRVFSFRRSGAERIK